jgi:hypothetical protein
MKPFKIISKFFTGIIVFVMVGALCTGLFSLAEGEKTDLKTILGEAAEYCRRLKKEVYHYVCQEDIVETGKKKLKYQNEYQIIKIGDKVKEKRTKITLGKQGIIIDKVKLKTKLYSYFGAMTPIFLLSEENQKQYSYNVFKGKKILGRPTYGLEVRTIKGDQQAIPMAHIWVDKLDRSVIKFELFPEAMPGFDHIIKYAKEKGYTYTIRDIHEFGLLRNGIRFPTRTEIAITFIEGGAKDSTADGFSSKVITKTKTHKIKTVFKYSDYRFFKVEIEDPQFKRLD